MYKLNPSEKWYLDAVADEENFIDDSVGSITISGLKEFSNQHKDNAKEEVLLKHSFAMILHKLRLKDGLSVPKLAKKLDVDEEELLNIESDSSFKPSLRTIMQIS